MLSLLSLVPILPFEAKAKLVWYERIPTKEGEYKDRGFGAEIPETTTYNVV